MSEMKKKQTHQEELYGELGRAFNFTKGDLEANRAGFMSHRQKKEYTKYLPILFSMMFVILLGYLFFTLLGLGLFFESFAQMDYLMDILCFGTQIILFGGLSLGLAWGLALFLSNTYRDLRQYRIVKIVRHVRTELRSRYKGNDLYLIAGEQEFPVPMKTYQIDWKGNTPYIIYHLPHSKTILSMEEAPSDDSQHAENIASIEQNEQLQGKSAQ